MNKVAIAAALAGGGLAIYFIAKRAGGSSGNRLIVRTYDEYENKLPGVTITIDGRVKNTDINGQAIFDNMALGAYDGLAEKSGYHSMTFAGEIIKGDNFWVVYLPLGA